MRFLVCALCNEEPFACPARFRRTYMKLHLERSHEISVAELKISKRPVAIDGSRIDWISTTNGTAKRLLVEVDIDLTARPGLNEHARGSQPQAKTARNVGMPRKADAQQNTRAGSETMESAQWNPAAMKSLYGTREGSGASL